MDVIEMVQCEGCKVYYSEEEVIYLHGTQLIAERVWLECGTLIGNTDTYRLRKHFESELEQDMRVLVSAVRSLDGYIYAIVREVSMFGTNVEFFLRPDGSAEYLDPEADYNPDNPGEEF